MSIHTPAHAHTHAQVPQRVFIKLRCEGKGARVGGARVGVHLFSSGERVAYNDTEQRPAAGSTCVLSLSESGVEGLGEGRMGRRGPGGCVGGT